MYMAGILIYFLTQIFSGVLEAVLELAFVDQAGMKDTEIHLPLHP